MSLDDNNKKNTGGNTEDIFAIMEKYRADQSKSKTEAAQPREPKPDAPVKNPLPESYAAKSGTERDLPQTTTLTQPAKKPAAKHAPARYAKKSRFSVSESFKKLTSSLSALFSRKSTAGKPEKATHAPRPKEERKAPVEARINNTALKNHFSDNASITSGVNAVSGDTSMNIAAHLADTAPAALTDSATIGIIPPADSTSSGKEKAKRVFGKIWYALTNMSFLAKALLYIAVVCIVSAYVSYYAITIANDVFAFVKTDREITVKVPENATDKEISYLLEKNGLIKYDWMFELYLIYKTDGSNSYIPGDKTLNSTMNYNQLIAALTTEYVENEQVSITIPEGYTVDEIIDLLVGKGIGTREGYVEAINSYPYQHEFVQELDKNGYPESRKYRLEGYLYPDTYFFYKTSPEYLVINKMLNNFDDKFWRHLDVFRADIAKHNMSVDDIVTLASMIQAEAKLFIDFEAVSYVFHNRLTHAGTFPYLQSDATIQYVLPEHVEDFTQEQLDLDNPYNTYKYKGLPPGAICNPGYDALSAAIYPDAPANSDGTSVNAYYFVSNKAGKTYYAETRAQHDRNKLTVKKDNEEYAKQNT